MAEAQGGASESSVAELRQLVESRAQVRGAGGGGCVRACVCVCVCACMYMCMCVCVRMRVCAGSAGGLTIRAAARVVGRMDVKLCCHSPVRGNGAARGQQLHSQSAELMPCHQALSSALPPKLPALRPHATSWSLFAVKDAHPAPNPTHRKRRRPVGRP